MLNCFYVYVHRKLSDNKPFYVGKGKGKRAYKSTGRNQKWNRTANKYGYTVEIVYENLSEEEAFQLEKDTILEFNYFGYNLCNLTNGGEGLSGYKMPEDRKKLISIAMKGVKKTPSAVEKTRLGSLGIKRTPEQLKLYSKVQIGNKNRQDNTEYLFYSDQDIFVGTRRSFEKYVDFKHLEINCLFKKQYMSLNKPYKGWSVLNGIQLLIFNTFFKEN